MAGYLKEVKEMRDVRTSSSFVKESKLLSKMITKVKAGIEERTKRVEEQQKIREAQLRLRYQMD